MRGVESNFSSRSLRSPSAVFTCEPGQEIAVCFPDLGCATSGIDDQDALLSARELLGCVMIGLEEDGEELPSPTPLNEILTQQNERAVRSVSRTVTLPAWLDAAAREQGLDLSQVLQDALKQLLHLQ